MRYKFLDVQTAISDHPENLPSIVLLCPRKVDRFRSRTFRLVTADQAQFFLVEVHEVNLDFSMPDRAKEYDPATDPHKIEGGGNDLWVTRSLDEDIKPAATSDLLDF